MGACQNSRHLARGGDACKTGGKIICNDGRRQQRSRALHSPLVELIGPDLHPLIFSHLSVHDLSRVAPTNASLDAEAVGRYASEQAVWLRTQNALDEMNTWEIAKMNRRNYTIEDAKQLHTTLICHLRKAGILPSKMVEAMAMNVPVAKTDELQRDEFSINGFDYEYYSSWVLKARGFSPSQMLHQLLCDMKELVTAVSIRLPPEAVIDFAYKVTEVSGYFTVDFGLC